MDAGQADHEAQATIVTPAANPTVTDWFPGVLVRYTDSNNYLEARLVYQGNAPEIELWQSIGGVRTMPSAVALGANKLTAGSSQTLRVAVRGSEVAVYLNNELRLQTTTTLTTGSRCGFGTMAACEGQPTYDAWSFKLT